MGTITLTAEGDALLDKLVAEHGFESRAQAVGTAILLLEFWFDKTKSGEILSNLKREGGSVAH